MAIDEKTRIAGAEQASTTSDERAASQHPRIIQTWPLTTADLADERADEATAGEGDEEERGNDPELVIPEAVKQWPAWMQRQWRETQRRRVWASSHPASRFTAFFTPAINILLGALVIVALLAFGVGAAIQAHPGGGSGSGSSGSSSAASSSSMSGMSSSSASAAPANVPDATQQYGNQPAKFVLDKDGVKHFTLTAQQVMWQPVKGQKVLAWTLDGTVPGPVIRATAGDHIRITIVNHLPEPTAIHWHGLEVPTDNDGVPPIGMSPIKPGQSYTYDFTLNDQDAGTHWYHSHFDDQKQVGGGMYGGFIVDPRPGSPEFAAMQPITSAQVNAFMFVANLDGYYVINGKSFPDTQPIVVKHGQTVHVSLIGADTLAMHPMHLHGHTFNIVAEDGHMLSSPIQKDTLQLAPGETYDITFYAWAAPGSVYPFHCHILAHLMNPGQSSGEMGGLITLVQYEK